MIKMKTNKRAITELTKRLVVNCVRNPLETYHVGSTPFSETGDNSDIKVIDALGQEFTFDQISRISDPEMKALMKEIVDRADGLCCTNRLRGFMLRIQRDSRAA